MSLSRSFAAFDAGWGCSNIRQTSTQWLSIQVSALSSVSPILHFTTVDCFVETTFFFLTCTASDKRNTRRSYFPLRQKIICIKKQNSKPIATLAYVYLVCRSSLPSLFAVMADSSLTPALPLCYWWDTGEWSGTQGANLDNDGFDKKKVLMIFPLWWLWLLHTHLHFHSSSQHLSLWGDCQI